MHTQFPPWERALADVKFVRGGAHPAPKAAEVTPPYSPRKPSRRSTACTARSVGMPCSCTRTQQNITHALHPPRQRTSSACAACKLTSRFYQHLLSSKVSKASCNL